MNIEGSVKLNRTTAIKIFEWCKSNYGPSKYKRKYPTLKYRSRPPYSLTGAEKNELYIYAIYDSDENYIYVDKTKHETLEDLVNTIIHEYTHYTQNMRYYYKIISKYESDMEKHPYEIRACQIAERDTNRCIKELFGVELE